MLGAQAIAVILSPDGRMLSVTEGDRLWLLRAVEAEGAPEELVAQTLVNRWAYLADRRPALYPTLGSLVQAYAQPVNPRWYPTGGKHRAALERGQDTVARAEKRRDEHSTKTQFRADVIAAVQRALYGPLTLPVGAVHYSVPRDSEQWRAVELVPGVLGRSNAIYSAPGAQGARYSIPGGKGGKRTRTGGAAGILAVVALGGMIAAAVVMSRSNRKGGPATSRPDSPDQGTVSSAIPATTTKQEKTGRP